MKGNPLLSFVARRIAALIALLVLVSFAIFILLYAAPGSAEQVLLGTGPTDAATVNAIRERYNLNASVLEQYWSWLQDVLQLDFGESIRTGESVEDAVQRSLGITATLGVYSFVIAVGLGVPLGVFAAMRRRGFIDRLVVGTSVLGLSAPAFVTGLVLLYVFAVVLEWFPAFYQETGRLDRLWNLTLPAATLALTVMALIVKLTRAAIIAELDSDYVLFARARHLQRHRVFFQYTLRNGLIPLVTAGGLVLAYLLSGAVIVEVVFSVPGIGSLLVESVESKDVPVVQALALVIAIIVMTINLIVDLTYFVIDPRIRLARTHE